MNLLLLLSALLTALTGAVGGARAPQVAQALSGTVEARRSVVPRLHRSGARPVQDVPSLTAIAYVEQDAFSLLPTEPHWAIRRRE